MSVHLSHATLCLIGLTVTRKSGKCHCLPHVERIHCLSICLATVCRVGLTVTGRVGSATVCPMWRDSIVYPSVSSHATLCGVGLTETGRAGVPLSAPRGGISLSIHLSHAILCHICLTVTGRTGSATVCPTWSNSIVYPFFSCYSLPCRFDCDRKSGKCHCLPHVEGFHCLSIYLTLLFAA